MGRATITSATSLPSFRNLATRSSARPETSEPSTPIRIRGAIRNRRYPSRPRPPAVSTKRSTFVESTTTLATPWRISHALDALRGDNVRAKATLGSRDGRETCERCGGDTMKITIIGAGNMGRAIGTRAVAGGHDVEILDRDPSEAQRLAGELGGSATAVAPGATMSGEVVVLALYYPGIKDAVGEYGDQLAGKVVVDITNPVDANTWDRL